MRISDWSSDVCSSDLAVAGLIRIGQPDQPVLVVGGAAWVRQRSLLEQHGLVAGARQGPGCRQADDAAPDADDLHWLGTFLPRAAGPAACTPAAPPLPYRRRAPQSRPPPRHPPSPPRTRPPP